MAAELGHFKDITLKNNKVCNLVIYHKSDNLLVIACEIKGGGLGTTSSRNIDSILHNFYIQWFPDELKELFKEEDLTYLCAENIWADGQIPNPSAIEFESNRNTYLDWFSYKSSKGTLDRLGKFGNLMWLRNEPQGAKDTKPAYSFSANTIFDISKFNPASMASIIPIFWVEN